MQYLHALGIDVDNDARYVQPAIVRQVVNWRTQRLTLAQARTEWD